jgi:hypothetical protein
MHQLLQPSVLALLVATAACAGGRGGTTPEPVARLRIENRSSSDVDIYLRPALRSITRLGFVPASDTADFALAPAFLTGAGSFHLEARPSGGGRPTLSEPFTARTGEEIFWSIPP